FLCPRRSVLHPGLATYNFGIQEARELIQAEQDVFPGRPELREGSLWANDRPGLGIDLNERLAARFPITEDPPFDMNRGNVRRRDGTVVRPECGEAAGSAPPSRPRRRGSGSARRELPGPPPLELPDSRQCPVRLVPGRPRAILTTNKRGNALYGHLEGP